MDLTYAIALTMLPQVGSNSARQLLEMFETPEKVFHLSHSQLSKVFNKHENIINAITDPALLHKAENELAFCEKEGIRVLYFTDPDYPQRLNSPDCEDTPVLLYYIGSANLNKERVISIVGTRRATEYGRSNTELLVNGMKQEEVLIVSGLALGIDSAAHRAALANMLPTVAVVAHGLEQIYPPQNRDLAKRIVQSGGGIITEYPHGTAINPGMFPARNRIIAALSDATVVVEASVKEVLSSLPILPTATIAMFSPFPVVWATPTRQAAIELLPVTKHNLSRTATTSLPPCHGNASMPLSAYRHNCH